MGGRSVRQISCRVEIPLDGRGKSLRQHLILSLLAVIAMVSVACGETDPSPSPLVLWVVLPWVAVWLGRPEVPDTTVYGTVLVLGSVALFLLGLVSFFFAWSLSVPRAPVPDNMATIERN